MFERIQKAASALGRKYDDMSGLGLEGKELKVLFVDGDTIKIRGPVSGKDVAITLAFPPGTARDEFLASKRTRGDAVKVGAKLTIEHHSQGLRPGESSENEIASETLPAVLAAHQLGMTIGELRYAKKLAWKVILEGYRPKST